MKTVASAPGKILITGGYLVLDRQNTGLVLTTSSRFHTEINDTFPRRQKEEKEVNLASYDNCDSKFNGNHFGTIEILSPQFLDGHWVYDIESNSVGTFSIKLVPRKGQEKNHYIETVLTVTLSILQNVNPEEFNNILTPTSHLSIKLQADNDFYSQREELKKRNLPLTRSSLEQLPSFCSTHTVIKDVHKTGLGSSAAMMSSVVAALVLHLKARKSDYLTKGNINCDENETQPNLVAIRQDDLVLIHNITQYAHSLAQGKIGSGFDVSAAVYGSQVYQRFSPEILKPILDVNNGQFSDIFSVLSNGSWDGNVETFKLPPGIQIVLADVDAGSNTPSMVSSLLKWRADNSEEANFIWSELAKCNKQVEKSIHALNEMSLSSSGEYTSIMKKIRASIDTLRFERDYNFTPIQTNIFKELVSIRESYLNIRRYFRELTEKAKVPIEPMKQTDLLNKCLEIPGVIASAVPGAGGYDAIFCLIFDDESTKSDLEAMWKQYEAMSVGPLLTNCDANGVRVWQSS